MSNSRQIQLAISTCPNDTFAFHALMNRLVDWRGLEFEITLLDIQQLNEALIAGKFDVAKASYQAALRVADKVQLLRSGSALGFGVGPLLLAAQPDTRPQSLDQLTLSPGEHTTAAMLFAMFYPDTTRVEPALFSTIMPRLIEGTADFGVCIHEGRFTWQQSGLHLVSDLGVLWESQTSCPLPLGGLFASRDLPIEIAREVQTVIRNSIKFALANPATTLPTMRRYAQEFDDTILMQHVDLYVNQWTVDLGLDGQQAIHELSRRAAQVGLINCEAELRVLAE